jgi:hypothetical protein
MKTIQSVFDTVMNDARDSAFEKRLRPTQLRNDSMDNAKKVLGEFLVRNESTRGAGRTVRGKLAVIASAVLALYVALPAHADIIPPKNYAVTPSGINVADGSLVYSVTDLAIGTLKLERSYQTSRVGPDDPPFGSNFSSNFDIYITSSPKSGFPTGAQYPIAHLGNKASGVFARSPPSTSVSANNMDAERGKLSYTGTQYVYVDGSDASGTIYTFSATIQAAGMPFPQFSRKIERIDFPDGRRQTFSYSGTNLKLVEDSAGYAMVFDYNATGDVTAACAFNRSQTYVSATSTCSSAALKATYGYTVTLSKPYLTSVTNPLSQVTTFTNTNWGMTCIKPPGFATCTMTLGNHADRIPTQTLQDGGTWGTSGASPDQLNNPDITDIADCTNQTSMTDPNSVVSWQTFTKTSPCSMTDGLGYTTSFKYEGAHQNNDTGPVYSDGTFLREAVYPEGNKYQAEYNGPFHAVSKETMVAKPGSPLASIFKQYGYGNSCTTLPGTYQNCAKPTWIKDPMLNQTDFTYASHGGLLTEMKPAPIAGASRPLKVYSYVSKYAYVKNSGGTLVQAATPVWVVNTETQCQTVAGTSTPTCDSGGPQVMTTYQYGANGTADNLLVRGITVAADGQTRRTCYGFDAYARKISETRPNAALSVCP